MAPFKLALTLTITAEEVTSSTTAETKVPKFAMSPLGILKNRLVILQEIHI
jgi:hypothetical protein